ncbi:MAG: response regulator [Candidatus Omnitrophica bacterium]|nr:response regulator [Candidatus Omnitrophota bacterium]
MSGKKYSILLAEDDQELQTALTKTLEKAGYLVTGVSNGEEAVEVFRKKVFDLVITDLSMPKKKGLEVLAEIKKGNSTLPVIIITAFGDWDTYQEAMEKNVFEYVNKPVKKEEILKLVQTALFYKEKGIHLTPKDFKS